MDELKKILESRVLSGKLDEAVSDFAKVNITIKNPDGSYRKLHDILQDIGDVWDKL